MVDIYGRTTNKFEKMINLSNVDQDEIVVFQNREGKLKTSNISIKDILKPVPEADFKKYVDENLNKHVNFYLRELNKTVLLGDEELRNKIDELEENN